MPVGIAIKVPSRYNGDVIKDIVNKSYGGKELNKMSFMIILSNGKETVITTDSRENYADGSFNDERQKIFTNNDKTIAVGIIGPIKRIYNGKIYDIPKIIADNILNGSTIEEALNTKIENDLTVKKILRLNRTNEVLTIAKIEKNGIFKVVDFIINDNVYKFYEDYNSYVNGDFDHNFAFKLLGRPEEIAFLSKEGLKNKSEEVMKIIIDLSKKMSEYEGKNSTIGGEIQSIIL